MLKWTDEDLVKLGDDLVAWFQASEKNIFVKQFAVERGMHSSHLHELAQRSPHLKHCMMRAKEIQEVKLMLFGMTQEGGRNGFLRMVMATHHGYRDRVDSSKEVTHKHSISEELKAKLLTHKPASNLVTSQPPVQAEPTPIAPAALRPTFIDVED